MYDKTKKIEPYCGLIRGREALEAYLKIYIMRKHREVLEKFKSKIG